MTCAGTAVADIWQTRQARPTLATAGVIRTSKPLTLLKPLSPAPCSAESDKHWESWSASRCNAEAQQTAEVKTTWCNHFAWRLVWCVADSIKHQHKWVQKHDDQGVGGCGGGGEAWWRVKKKNGICFAVLHLYSEARLNTLCSQAVPLLPWQQISRQSF